MPLVERSGQGFITGGVIDDTPDWLGSYNEGMNASLDQTTARIGQQEARQRMGQNAAEEARRAQAWGWKAEDRQAEIDAANSGKLPGMAQPQGPGLGLMDPMKLPAPIAPSPGLMEEGAAPNGAITADQRVSMLPEWARLEQSEGLPPNFLETISMLESSGGVNTGSGQTYTGIFQIGPEVARDFGVTPEQLRDPRVNAQIAAKLAGRNARQLREALGREPQPWEIYLAHQQGLGGALALLRNGNMSAVEALTIAYRGDRSRAEQAVVQNGGNPQMTAAEFAQKWAQKFGGALPQPFTGEAGVGQQLTSVLPHGPTGRALLGGRAPAGLQDNTGISVSEQTSLADAKSDLPAGLQTGETQPAPAAPATPATSQVAAEPGLSIPEPSTGDVVPRVSQEEAGLMQPGQGSIATQIMRTPAGQQTTLPDMGPYIVEPAKIRADKFELQQARQVLEQQYERARRLRDFETMAALEGKAAEINAAERLMTNMEAIAAMQAGDDNTMAQQLSRLSNGKLRLQPVQPSGTYNVYYDGQMVYQNVTKNGLIAALRSEFDAQYQAQVAEATKRAYDRDDKVFESQLKIGEGLAIREADMIKQINIDAAKAAVERANPEYHIDVAEDGTVTAVPKTGGGPPIMRKLTPVLDPSGEPVMVGGQPKFVLKEVPVSGATVSTQ